MKRYRIEYANSFEDYGDFEGGGIASEDCSDWAETLDEARKLAATLSEQFIRAELVDTSLPRGAAAIEVWEDGERRS